MDVHAGEKWYSTVCSVGAIVVRAPASPVELECGGAPMSTSGPAEHVDASTADPAIGTKIGKRYVDEDSGLELLGIKAGPNVITVNGKPLVLKEAKPLPSSD